MFLLSVVKVVIEASHSEFFLMIGDFVNKQTLYIIYLQYCQKFFPLPDFFFFSIYLWYLNVSDYKTKYILYIRQI